VDLIGPIEPMSERGHRYILNVIDYATRYPEARALKNITTETVAKALVEIYSRVGILSFYQVLRVKSAESCLSNNSSLHHITQCATDYVKNSMER
jgi:ribosomal protein S26